MQEAGKSCPHCGAPLHEGASFCPNCAQSVNRRDEPKIPRPVWKRSVRAAAAFLTLAVLLLGVWLCRRPRTYDGMGEVIYTDRDGDYQLCIAWADTPFTPMTDRYSTAQLDYDYRYPALFYINHVESDTHAAETFLQKVDSITAEVTQPDQPLSISCTQPQRETSYIPDAAAISYVDFNVGEAGEYTAQLVFTVTMKNGDVIRVRQNHHFESINTYTYTPEDTPMGTIEELQALINRIDETVEEGAVVNVYLPPVTYEGGLVLEGRSVNLIGSQDGRTVFTGTVRVSMNRSWICEFENIDFTGPGSGVGISAAARVHLIGCGVTGWKTGVLAYGTSWVWAIESRFENNEVGFHFNSDGSNVSNIHYRDNIFTGNGTGLLLEQVPTDMTLYFENSRFSGNGTDIDNRCGQDLDLSEAVFE